MFKSYKKISLATKILVAMIIGCILGFLFKGSFGAWSQVTTPIGDAFLRLMKMTILPYIFCSIITGIAGIADLRKLKEIGGRFLLYWAIVSALAAASGIIWSYIINPGVGVSLGTPADAYTTEGVSVIDSVVKWLPDNVFASFANFNIIQVIIFSLFLGIAISLLSDGPFKDFIGNLFESGEKVMTKVIEMVMRLTPIGVVCLMMNITGSLGAEVLGALGKMLLTQYVAYATIMIVVFPFFLWLAKVSPIQHYLNIFPVMIFGFTTCSSAASLPLAMKVTKERCGVPHDTVSLIAPPAATISQQGCCAEMPIYAVFAAQLYGRDYSFGELAILIFLGIIMAAGVAGVPGGGIMMAAIMLQTMNLPLTIVPWIAGIYRLIDMPNTMLNIVGDTVGMVLVSSQMGDLNRDVFNAKVGARDRVEA